MSPLAAPGRSSMQGFALTLAGALLACASSGSDSRAGISAAPAWLGEPPAGCAAGHSGPTLDPGDAIRQARSSALENLAAQHLGVRVESELRIGARGVLLERTAHETYGVLDVSRIVAMGSRDVGRRAAHSNAHPTLREVYALACPADADSASIPSPRHPAWLLNPPSDPTRVCVLGIGGPTRDPGDQPAAALRDGRRALASGIESLIEQRLLDDGKGYARVVSLSHPTRRARALAAAVPALERSWADPRGRGPLATPGLVYVLVCSER